jgi:flagellar hook-length control protein FliK
VDVRVDNQPVKQQLTAMPVTQEQPLEDAAVELKAEPKVQHIVVNLLKKIVNAEVPKSGSETASMEELLTQLIQQLEASELKGEQVLAGIDLSALLEQLEQFPIMQLNPEDRVNVDLPNGEESLRQLVSQMADQLAVATEQNTPAAIPVNADQAMNMLPLDELQITATSMADSMVRARQILQQVIDSVSAQKSADKPVIQPNVQPVAGEESLVKSEPLMTAEATEEVDPRFAALLKPRSENRLPQQTLREQVRGDNPKANQGQLKQSGENVQQQSDLNLEQSKVADFTERFTSQQKPAFENLLQQSSLQAQPGMSVHSQSAFGKVMPQTPMVQLPSGQQVAESQIFDQVVTRMSGSFNGESGRMVLRMQPAELGSLKLELMVEGDRIRANLQAQSQQVQEVLERNLPQLRSALAEQGLKIDQFQVDVNRDQSQQDHFDQLAQQRQQRQDAQAQRRWAQDLEPEEQIIPLAHLMQNGGGGISLHV